jgi:predicted house-cleaning noncanonical NTP pyrophosphatase (MazG superfamily)
LIYHIALVSKLFKNVSLKDDRDLIYHILARKNIMESLQKKAQESTGELNQEEEDAHVQLLEQIDVMASILQGIID